MFVRVPIRLACIGLSLAGVPALLAAQTTPDPDALKRADAAFRAGYADLQAGNLQQAREKFTHAAQLAPQIPEAHEALAEVLFELGKPAESIPEFQTALKLKPGDQRIESNIAFAYAKSGDQTNAVAHFSAAYQASQQPGAPPPDVDFLAAYGRSLALTGNPSQAIKLFQAAIDRGAVTPDVFDDLGALYAQSANWAAAQPEFERALVLNNAYVPARIHLGVLQRQVYDTDASLATLQAAITADPDNPIAQVEFARTLEAAGRDDDAILHLQRSIKLNPDTAGAANELAMVLQRQGRQQEAVPWFQQALQRDPHNASILTNLGLALTLTGNAKDALAYFQQAQADAPPDATLLKDRGVAHIQISAFDEAIADFQAALALDPNDSQLHYDLGMAYKFKDRVDDAIAELTRAGQMDPTLQDPPYTLGILYMQTGKLDQAVVELKKAVALRPENGDAWAILGSTLKQDSRLDEARDALERAIPLLPGQPGPRVTLAGVLAEQAGAATSAADAAEGAGDTAKADQLRAQVKDLRTQAAEYRRQGADLARGAVSRQKANFAMNAGNQLLLKGQIDDAVARYQESIADDPSFADPHSQLAIAYDRQGRPAEAAMERAKAHSLAAAK